VIWIKRGKNAPLQWRKRVEEHQALFIETKEVMDWSSLPLHDEISVD
jgi:hypothetical protein